MCVLGVLKPSFLIIAISIFEYPVNNFGMIPEKDKIHEDSLAARHRDECGCRVER